MKKRSYALISVLLLATLILSACGRSAKDSYSSEDGGANGDIMYDTPAEDNYSDSLKNEIGSGSVTENSTSVQDGQKLIKTVRLTLETKDFEKAISEIEKYAVQHGGYIENSVIKGGSAYSDYVTERYAVYVVRIPAENLEMYVEDASRDLNVLNKEQGVTNVTEKYFDTQARINSLKVQEERLLAMLSKATELSYLLELESKLSEVRYEIESYTSQLNRLESQISYATVNITLNEVVEYKKITETPKSYAERLSTAIKDSWDEFVDSIQDFSIDVVYALPGLIIFAIIVSVIVIVILKTLKKRRSRAVSPSKAQNQSPKSNSDSEK